MDTKKLRYSLLMLVGIITFGTCGYYFVEHMPLFEAFYMTIITITTVGFAEVIPLSQSGRTITVIIIVLGITAGTYTIGVLVRALVEGELVKIFGRIKVQKQVSELKNHFIICGFGRIGRIVCSELNDDKIRFVIIEQDPTVIEHIEAQKYLYLDMDATTEEALEQAGIMKAKGIVTAVNSDANNVFITMTAKSLRPDVFVLARASEEQNEAKLFRAGATRVVSPYLIGGRRIAQMLKKPTVVDFIDCAMMGSHLDLMMEEAAIGDNSSLIGKSLIDSYLRRDYGVIIVAIKKLTGDMIFNPLPSQALEAGDVIVVIGKKEDLKRMNTIL
ncbi:MAG: potassium channel protein [Desulfobacterales bacterium]|jgi:voltage-gated potassium channel